MNDKAIQVQDLVRRYDGLVALAGISFDVGAGEIFGFLGPNGAGKTTTIKILTGQLRPSAGRAWVMGCDVTAERASLKPQIGVVFETATPFDTPRLMTELVTWMREERGSERLHPLLLIGLWVVVFLEIHPFQDGNGRLSRVLTTLLLLQAGYAYVPYSSLESVIEQNKEAYYLALRHTQGTIRSDAPSWRPWLLFFLRSLAEQVRRLNIKVERERLVLAPLPELSLQIVEFAREHGRVTMGDIIRLTGASRNTLKQHFRALVAHGHITQHGSGRGSWYA